MIQIKQVHEINRQSYPGPKRISCGIYYKLRLLIWLDVVNNGISKGSIIHFQVPISGKIQVKLLVLSMSAGFICHANDALI